MTEIDDTYARTARGARLESMKAQGYKLSNAVGVGGIERLLTRKERSQLPYQGNLLNSEGMEVRAFDHCKVWNKDGHAALFTSEPYGLGAGGMKWLLDLCQRFNLTVHIDARYSVHLPGQTLWITLEKAK